MREPALTDQFGSLYQFLSSNGYQSLATQLNIAPLAAPTVRTYEGGMVQGFFSDRLVFRASYFHNQFGREIEYVGGVLLPNLIPGLTAAQKLALESALGYYYTDDYGLTVNTEAFRAQGIETTVESGLGRSIFLRGGYTYLDARRAALLRQRQRSALGRLRPKLQRHSHRRHFAARGRQAIPPPAAHRLFHGNLRAKEDHRSL